VSQAISISMFDLKGCWKKFKSLVSCIFYSILCFGLFGLTLVRTSCLILLLSPILFLTSDPDCFKRFVNGFVKNNYFQVPFTNLHKETNEALWPYLRVSYSILQNDHFVGSYGLLTKPRVGGRPEIILEYAEDESGPWKEYQFLYKPGNISTAPVFIGTNLIAIQR
jgi:hypothetical protein